MDNSKDLMLIETMVKVAAINKLLVKSGIISDADLQNEMTVISKELVEQMKSISPELFETTDKN